MANSYYIGRKKTVFNCSETKNHIKHINQIGFQLSWDQKPYNSINQIDYRLLRGQKSHKKHSPNRFLNFVRLVQNVFNILLAMLLISTTSWNGETVCSITDWNVSGVTFRMCCVMCSFREVSNRSTKYNSFQIVPQSGHTH